MKSIYQFLIFLCATTLFAQNAVQPSKYLLPIGAKIGSKISLATDTLLPHEKKLDGAALFVASAFSPDLVSSKASFDSTIKKYNYLYTLSYDMNYGTMMNFLAKVKDTFSIRQQVLRFGGNVSNIIGSVIIAEIPVKFVKEFARETNVSIIEADIMKKKSNDLAREQTRVNDVQRGLGLQSQYLGRNVVVGIIDTGIDEDHQDFKDANGSRIKFLWDVNNNVKNSNAPYGYGFEYSKQDIDAGLCNQADNNGHGTHVSGTAAGNGNASQGLERGVAPMSDIVFVKGANDDGNGEGHFPDKNVLNGCDYIFNKAKQLGKPCVINLSISGHAGAHDGSSLYEQTITNLTGEGRIIVIANGNQQEKILHCGDEPVKTGSPYEIPLLCHQGAKVAFTEVWYDQGSLSASVVVRLKEAILTTPEHGLLGYTKFVTQNAQIIQEPLNIQGVGLIGYITIVSSFDPEKSNRGKSFMIVIEAAQGFDLNQFYFGIFLQGNAKIDAYTYANSVFYPKGFIPVSGINGGDNIQTVGTPATAEQVIAVGSYTSRNQWTDFTGQTNYVLSGSELQPLGALSNFSSLGPTRDGRLKPEIVAPGEEIISVLSSDVKITENNAKFIINKYYQAMPGTSMASPHVTGIVALMLECNPRLNYESVSKILRTTAVAPYKDFKPNIGYGYGYVNAYNAILATIPTKSVDDNSNSSIFSQNVKISPNPTSEKAVISFELAKDNNVKIGLYDNSGKEIYNIVSGKMERGIHTFSLSVSELMQGTYFVKSITDDHKTKITPLVVVK